MAIDDVLSGVKMKDLLLMKLKYDSDYKQKVVSCIV